MDENFNKCRKNFFKFFNHYDGNYNQNNHFNPYANNIILFRNIIGNKMKNFKQQVLNVIQSFDKDNHPTKSIFLDKFSGFVEENSKGDVELKKIITSVLTFIYHKFINKISCLSPKINNEASFALLNSRKWNFKKYDKGKSLKWNLKNGKPILNPEYHEITQKFNKVAKGSSKNNIKDKLMYEEKKLDGDFKNLEELEKIVFDDDFELLENIVNENNRLIDLNDDILFKTEDYFPFKNDSEFMEIEDEKESKKLLQHKVLNFVVEKNDSIQFNASDLFSSLPNYLTKEKIKIYLPKNKKDLNFNNWHMGANNDFFEISNENPNLKTIKFKNIIKTINILNNETGGDCLIKPIFNFDNEIIEIDLIIK